MTTPDAVGQGPREAEPQEDAERQEPRALRTALAPFGAGLRHGWALLAHWATAGYQSDDEIRRRKVKTHLDKYEDDREATRTQVRRLGKRTAKISSDLAHYGATHQEATRLRDMSGELRRFHTAQKTLEGMAFSVELAQPTEAQIRRVRTLTGLARFGGVIVPSGGLCLLLLVLLPISGLVALPLLAGAAWWLGRHPVELTTRPLHPDLLRPELEPLTDEDEDDAGDDRPKEVRAFDAALTAAGLLTAKAPATEVVAAPDWSGGNGCRMTLDLPKGGGKLVRDVLKKAEVVAGELGKPSPQVVLTEVPASEGGHGRRMRVWVADEDPYLIGGPTTSPLAGASEWDVWQGAPLGRTAEQERRTLPYVGPGGLTSAFVSGRMRYGKSMIMRLIVGAGALDYGVRLYVANAKQGRDWAPTKKFAHRVVEGTTPDDLDAFEAMLDELADDVQDRYRQFATLDPALIPDNQLTPDLARDHGMPLLLLAADELQLYFKRMTSEQRERVIKKLEGLLLSGPAAGLYVVAGTQRPDSEEVPTGLRDLFGLRIAVLCPDSRSSRMCLGDPASDAGANASTQLTVDHVGVCIVANGPEWEVLKVDLLEPADWEEVCDQGRSLREARGLLSGAAKGQAAPAAPGRKIPDPLRWLRAALAEQGDDAEYVTLDQLHTHLRTTGDAARWSRWDHLDDKGRRRELGKEIARELRDASVTLASARIKEEAGMPRGWYRADVDRALANI